MSATQEAFLHFPANEFCTTIMSMGPPFSGKTWMLLKCLKYWLKVGMFEKYFIVLPQFKNEMEGSYDFLNDKQYEDHVFIYESFHEDKALELIGEQEKSRALFKSGKIKQQPRYFFCIDDATSQGSSMFKSKVLKRFATENRHLFIHSWFLMHYDKGTIEPAVRNNIMWVCLYPLKAVLLQKAYVDYVNYPEFKKFDTFEAFFDKYVMPKKHGFLLMRTKGKYNPNPSNWFQNENEIEEKK
jgi:hypothetical protein